MNGGRLGGLRAGRFAGLFAGPFAGCVAPAAIAVIGGAAALAGPPELGELLVQTLVVGLFVLGLDIAWGLAGLPLLLHPALFGVAALATSLTGTALGGSPLFPAPVALALAQLAGACAATVVALACALWLMRERGVVLLAASLLAAAAIDDLGARLIGAPSLTHAWAAATATPVAARATEPAVWIALAVSGYALMLALVLRRSRLGFAARALRDSEAAARAIGMPVYRRKVAIATVSGAYAGLAGAIAAAFGPDLARWPFAPGLPGLAGAEAAPGLSLAVGALLLLTAGGRGRIWGGVLVLALLQALGWLLGPVGPLGSPGADPPEALRALAGLLAPGWTLPWPPSPEQLHGLRLGLLPGLLAGAALLAVLARGRHRSRHGRQGTTATPSRPAPARDAIGAIGAADGGVGQALAAR